MKLRPAKSKLNAKAARKKVRRGARLPITVKVRSAGRPTGRVVVRGVGRAKTRLNKSGKARLVLRVPKRAPRGKHRIRVVYQGSDTVQRASTRLVVRVR